MVCPQPGLPGGTPGQAEDGDGDGDSLGVPEDPSAEHDPDLVDRLGGQDEKGRMGRRLQWER